MRAMSIGLRSRLGDELPRVIATFLAVAPRFVVVIGLTVGLTASTVHAANGFWNTADGNWSMTTNWWTTAAGTTPVSVVPSGSAETATFNATVVSGTQRVYLNGNYTLGALTVGNTGATTLLGGNYGGGTPVEAANDLTLATSITINAGAGPVTLGNPGGTAAVNIRLGSAVAVTNNSVGRLTLNNEISASSLSRTLTLAGSGPVELAGPAGDGTGTLALTITNTGMVTLAGSNTYTGATTLNTTGGVAIGSNTPFGSSAVLVNNNPSLFIVGGNRTLSNTITQDSGGSRRISVYGPGSLTLSGTLSLANTTSNAVLTVGGNADMTISGPITNGASSGSALTQLNVGTVTLSGTSNYTGGTNFTAGTTRLDFANAGFATNILYNGVTAAAVTVGGQLALVGKAGTTNQQSVAAFGSASNTAGRVTLTAGTGGTVTLQATSATSNVNSFLDFTINAGGTVNFSGGTANAIAGSGRFTVNDYTDFAWLDAGKNLVAAGANVTASVTGTGAGSNTTYYKLTDSLTRTADNFLFKGIRLNSSGTSNGTLNLGGLQLRAAGNSSSSFLYAGGGTGEYTIENGTLTSEGPSWATELTFGITSGATLTIASSAAISDSPALVSVLKAGGGTLAVDGAKSYTGVTRVYGGVLEVNNLANGGTASGIGASTNATGNLRFDGGTLRYTGGTVSTDRSFTIDSDGAVIDASGTGPLTWAPASGLTYNNSFLTLTGTNGNGNTFGGGAGVIGDGSSKTVLTKAGPGTWLLAGANTFSGGVRLDGGILGLTGTETTGTSGPLGRVGFVSFRGGTLQYSATNTADYSARIKESTGPVAIDTNGQAVSFNHSLDASNVGGLTKAGTGMLTLAAPNSFTGATAVLAGTLRVGANGTLAGTTGLTAALGAMLDNASGTAITKPLSLAEGSSLLTSAAGSSFAPQSLTLVGDLGDGWIPIALGATAGDGLIKGGLLTLTLANLAAGVYGITGNSTGFSGAFAAASINGFSLTSPDSGATFVGTGDGFNYSFANSTNVLTVAAVPEPALAGAVAVALAGLAVAARRRRSRPA